ncbi:MULTISPECIES: helix-turn-helix domain-containing protein [unclassified Sphingopyxis]|uniref:helix-turn-helix domain-containing protein n=1 Tax=unclassified Sphingopyxis TaxID=2614943 RepID=UPI0028614C0E|nr:MULTISPECIES: helix-turn-helix domain-containing protein [unclassified Sphingopyxis]MDR7058729.1 DNA-binding XRE family transcriptional regulator [Sphingopyxis sp. BE235]MDR7179085.1 DNA-binding XRE family transcriptional regulator [Sphingopyxis sp. BE249]
MAMTVYLDNTPRSAGNGRASRRQLRLPLHGSKAAGAEIEALVHNISATGMLVESKVPLAIGEIVEVNLPHSGKTATRVIWTSGGIAGCQFEIPISPATLSAAQLRSVVGVDAPAPDHQPAPAESFGVRLQRLRTAKELTQGQLAAHLGVSEPSISAWELDKARPKAGRMEALSLALGVEIAELLGIDEAENLNELVAKAKAQIAKAAGVSPGSIKFTIEM